MKQYAIRYDTDKNAWRHGLYASLESAIKDAALHARSLWGRAVGVYICEWDGNEYGRRLWDSRGGA